MKENLSNSHPGIIDLELFRTGEQTSDRISAHISQCQECQQEIFRLENLSKTLDVTPATHNFSFDREHDMLSFIAQRSEEIKSQSAKAPLKFINYLTRIAAIITILITASVLMTPSKEETPQLFAQYDINQDQSVDIVDAFLFAKQNQDSAQNLDEMINQIVSVER